MPTNRFVLEDGQKDQKTERFVLDAEESIKPVGNMGNIGLGAIRGAGSIGATLLSPIDMAAKAMGIQNSLIGRDDRRQAIDEWARSIDGNPESIPYQVGKLGTEIAGTAGVGGSMARGVQALSKAPIVGQIANSIRTGGMVTGMKPGVADMATRIGGGAASGAAMAGLVNPKDAVTGGVIGGAMPTAVKTAGMAGSLVNQGVKSALNKAGVKLDPMVSPEVSSLYQKAKSLGIDIPADRIVDNRPLNAVSASLNYLPLSGRMATEDKMINQMNRAVSRTFGQDSPNVTMALRKANTELGKRFDDTLQKTKVNVDNEFLNDLGDIDTLITNELNPMEARVISNKINEILAKGGNGVMDGQAAYNIKKSLDRIGNRNTNDAYYARELKKRLMSALNRSLPQKEAEDFATLRKQYGNMLDLEGIAQNGAEGGISIGRLANMKNINNPELQDLADISAQFLKTRENPHGAAQRIAMGALGAGGIAGGAATGTLPLIAGAMGAGRATNTLLNSSVLRNALADRPELYKQLLNPSSSPLLRALPVVGAPGLLQ